MEVVLYGETNELHPLAALGGAKQKGLSHLGFGRENSNKTPSLVVDPKRSYLFCGWKSEIIFEKGTWGSGTQGSVGNFLGEIFGCAGGFQEMKRNGTGERW